MRRLVAFALALAALVSTLAFPRAAGAAEWNGIEPGVTSVEAIRARYGPPSKEVKAKVNNYDTTEWTYEGERAPGGFSRMVIEFGILLPAGYSPNTVRVLRLDPRRFIFTKDMVVAGWGEPDRATTENDRDIFFYTSGLLVTFDKDGVMATSMYFTVKQPDPAPAASGAPAPPRPATPAPAPAKPTPPSQPPGTPPVRR
jgi:hypothetical protein